MMARLRDEDFMTWQVSLGSCRDGLSVLEASGLGRVLVVVVVVEDRCSSSSIWTRTVSLSDQGVMYLGSLIAQRKAVPANSRK